MRVLMVFRAPVGGLFRHVRDLATTLPALGHEVGLVCDNLTGGAAASSALAAIAPHCALGVHRLPMPRLPGIGDMLAARRIAAHCAGLKPDIVHGHGAKGGAYARLVAGPLGAKALYTPHGGSLHYSWRTPQGALFLGTERLLLRRTAGLLFVCDYERRAFDEKVGLRSVSNAVVHNGLAAAEFAPVVPDPRASDVLFIGELRRLKGVDVLVEALSIAARTRPLTATIVGAGPDHEAFQTLVMNRGLADRVRFAGAMPARQAFPLGRVLAVPSRAESFPYIVLEAAAAGLPIVASSVGGIPEVLEQRSLVAPGDPTGLANRLIEMVSDLEGERAYAADLAARIEPAYNLEAMAAAVSRFYVAVSRL